MSLESLGGRMPPGRPAAVFAGGKTHVFAIAAGGAMNHWSSTDGIGWSGPDALPPGPTNLEPSYPCAVAFQNGVHVFAIAVTTPITSPAFTPTLSAFAR